jgi:hypothetical protein
LHRNQVVNISEFSNLHSFAGFFIKLHVNVPQFKP